MQNQIKQSRLTFCTRLNNCPCIISNLVSLVSLQVQEAKHFL